MSNPDPFGQDDENHSAGDVTNPYKPSSTATAAAPPPPSAVDPVSQKVNRATGVVIGVLSVLGMVAMIAQGAPFIAALILMSPVFPAVGIFLLRTCRRTWGLDLIINAGISVAVGLSVVLAGVVVCTAVFALS